MRIGDGLDLTYCTNIHPGNGWNEVFANLAAYGPALKSRLSPDAPFGIGLRLSNRESEEVLREDHLSSLAAFLEENGLYVRLMNGYPYGAFHGAPVKAGVFAPDWRDEERAAYTVRLLKILTRLMPEDGEGGISTLPLSYKPWIQAEDHAARQAMVRNLATVAGAMLRAREEHGRRVRLEIEPEPDGLIENSAEVVAFFHEWLFPYGSRELSAALGISRLKAEEALREHVCICLDSCHFAVEYEEPDAVLRAFADAGIRVGRLQVSSALRVTLPGEGVLAQLEPFADSTYLHQVIERKQDGSLHRYRDLDVALQSAQSAAEREWRIHFHVPLFTPECGSLGSTQEYNARLLERVQSNPFTEHLEIETYTWDLLPSALKLNLTDSIEREYRWVQETMCKKQ